jgi:hypothetical protein
MRTRYLKISHPSEGGKNFRVVSLHERFDSLAQSELEILQGDGAAGDSVLFEIVEMTEDEFEVLGEFDGW